MKKVDQLSWEDEGYNSVKLAYDRTNSRRVLVKLKLKQLNALVQLSWSVMTSPQDGSHTCL